MRDLRIDSKEELADLICRYSRQDNESPVIFNWNFHLDEFYPSEEAKIDPAIWKTLYCILPEAPPLI